MKKDIYKSYLLKNASFTGVFELPTLKGYFGDLPKGVISFPEARKNKKWEPDNWVHFYVDDDQFQCIWNSPKHYLSLFQRSAGVITPDFSVYFDMPFHLQINNVARNRALGHWLEENGVPVIPNVRWGERRTYDFVFAGIPQHSVVAVGSHGCLKNNDSRFYFVMGLQEMIARLEPSAIVVVGKAPDSIFASVRDQGIKVVNFESQTALFFSNRKKETEATPKLCKSTNEERLFIQTDTSTTKAPDNISVR